MRLGERLRTLGVPAPSPSYEALAREASDEVLVTDGVGRIAFCSPSFSRRWDLDRWALVGRDAFDWVHPQDREAAREVLARALERGTADSEHRYVVKATGEVRWCRVRYSDARHQRRVRGVIWNCQDITAERRSVEALRYSATHDTLTGLANRRLLFAAFATAREAGDDAGLVLLNLDGTRGVNDRFGHGAGDDVVRAVADRLADLVGELVGSAGRLGRLDGDEFAVLVRGEERDVAAALTALADGALALVRRPVTVEGRTVVVTAGAGTSVLTRDELPGPAEESGRELFHRADIALAAAKELGRDRWVPFSHQLLDAAHDRAELAHDLREAIAAGHLRVVHQPLVDLADGRVLGFEALVRWTHPERGEIPPTVFVPLAEESEAILRLGEFVLEQALAALARFRAVVPGLEIAVNLSGHQLLHPGLVDGVALALARHGIDPAALCLEVTESAAVADLASAGNVLARLRALGVRVALDDFGTGYSSLSYLRRLPVDVLKIDKSFVDDGTDATGAAVLSGIVTLSSALGLVTVAEGIETHQVRDVVRAAGCTWGQGYLFARPLEFAAACELLAQNSLWRSTTA